MDEQLLEKSMDDLSIEEKAKLWEEWVKGGVNDFLEAYLPFAVQGDINFKYSYELVENLESGPVYDDSKVTAVLMSLLLQFDKPVDVIKK